MLARRGRTRIALIVGACVALGSLLLRNPEVIRHPSFWAEELDLYFANAHAFGAAAFLENASLHAGYLNLAASLAAWLAALVSLEHAARVTVGLGFLMQATPLLVAVFGRRRWAESVTLRCLLAAVLLWFPYASGTAEAWLNTINAQVHFGVLGLLLVLGDEPLSRVGRVASNFGLLLAGLSGPYAVALMPLFVWRSHTEVGAWRQQQTRVILAAAAVQVAVAAFGWSTGLLTDAKSPASVGSATIYAAALFQFWFPIVGEYAGSLILHALGLPLPAAGKSVSPMAIAVVCTLPMLAVLSFARAREMHVRLAIFAGIIWCALTVAFSVNAFPAFRYAVPGATAFGIALLGFVSSAPRRFAAPTLAVLAIGIATGVVEWLAIPARFQPPPWELQVADWRAEPDTKLLGAPKGWFTHLAEPTRLQGLRDAWNSETVRELTAALPRSSVTIPNGLPAYFEARALACADDAQVRIGLVDAAGIELGALRSQIRGCQSLYLNSMNFAFSGFHDFGSVRGISLQLQSGSILRLGAFEIGTPVLRMNHPVSGR